ncbi:hypothetical protein AWB69_05966 [Caballeronia udeis]|uniref:Uncharacterized protein n=1 Tax=Caballeronia udeis TaxID=1232866 RepID=A0A158IGC1_9BURK|nr:hypothetical protein [Caballeronia udeis]SAL55605.1 hypothetical protein AWB69_05966 [Caballeronia udeis]
MAQTSVVEANPSSFVVKVGSMSARVLMRETQKAAENVSRSSYELGALLSRVKHKINVEHDKAFWYDSFTDYVKKELRVDVAQANGFIRVFERLENEKIEYSVVETLPFSVLQHVAKMLTHDNAPELVQQLSGKSVLEVKSLVAGLVPKDAAKVEAARRSAAVRRANKAEKAAGTTVDHGYVPKDPAPVDDVQDVDAKDIPNKAAPATNPVDGEGAAVAYLKGLGAGAAVALVHKLFPKEFFGAVDTLLSSEAKVTVKPGKKTVKAKPEQPAA